MHGGAESVRCTYRPIPWTNPEAWANALKGAPGFCWLDSSGLVGQRSRWSYIGINPIDVITYQSGVDSPGTFWQRLSASLDSAPPPAEGEPPFKGGAIGYIGYDLGLASEGVISSHTGEDSGLDAWVGIYDNVLAFDRLNQAAWCLGPPPAVEPTQPLSREIARLNWRPEVTRKSYMEAAARIKEYIKAGDIYQANLTVAYLADRPTSLDVFDLYLQLRETLKAPFGAFIAGSGYPTILSASPERFITVNADGYVETRPIKGTRPRGATPEADAHLANELLNSEKDRAENLMIVDLMRNDLSRSARVGSVKVDALCTLESFERVHHLVSSVRVQLRSDVTPINLLQSTLPGGSITGAPKRRAMQIIDELEVRRRGAYCGTAFWIGKDGAMDSSILIRSIFAGPNRLLAHAGGGIVFDSQIGAEFEEMELKINPLLIGHKLACDADPSPISQT